MNLSTMINADFSRTTFPRATLGLLLIALVVSWTAQLPQHAIAQDGFGEDAKAGGKDPGLDAKGRRKEKGDLDIEVKRAEPVVILQLRERNPTTPQELVEAAKITLNYGRPDEAKKYLAKLLASKPAGALLVELAKKYGSDLFLRFSSAKGLEPEGAKVATLVLTAYNDSVHDPVRLKDLATQLGSEQASVRRGARGDLVEAGVPALAPLLAILADNGQATLHVEAQRTLIEMGPTIEAPLMAALDSTSVMLQTRVIETLAAAGASTYASRLLRPALDPAGDAGLQAAAQLALDKLMGRVPTRSQAELYLQRRLQQLLASQTRGAADPEGKVSVWMWDEGKLSPVERKLAAADAPLLEAARVSSDLVALNGDKDEYQVLRLVSLWELDGIQRFTQERLPTSAASHGTDVKYTVAQVEETLKLALAQQKLFAAQTAAEQLGKIGKASLFERLDQSEGALSVALSHSDRRVRLAAARSIVALKPTREFAGSNKVAEVLAFLASTAGTRQVLVCDGRNSAAQTVGGICRELGYESSVAYTGHQALLEATSNPDIDFILIDDAIERPRAAELVQLLRRDYRTARLPIGVMVRDERTQALNYATTGDKLTIVFPRLHEARDAAFQLDKLTALAGRSLVSQEERLAQAAQALAALAPLAKDLEGPLASEVLAQEPALIRALAAPGLAAEAAGILGDLATPKAQTALVEFANTMAEPIASRQAAAGAFAQALKVRGPLLTRKQIEQVYDRYNASETLDRETQAVLASLLDSLESRATPVGGLGPATPAAEVDSEAAAP